MVPSLSLIMRESNEKKGEHRAKDVYEIQKVSPC